MQLDGTEIDGAEWVSIADVAEYVTPRLTLRLASAYQAYKFGTTLYLEYGMPRP